MGSSPCLPAKFLRTDRERAALAWSEAVTRVADGHVPDQVFEEARRHFTDAELVNLTLYLPEIEALT